MYNFSARKLNQLVYHKRVETSVDFTAGLQDGVKPTLEMILQPKTL